MPSALEASAQEIHKQKRNDLKLPFKQNAPTKTVPRLALGLSGKTVNKGEFVVTAVRVYKKHTPAKEMFDHRQAWLAEDGPQYIVFKIYSRDGKTVYRVAIRKSDFWTTCPCEDRTNNCWHMRKALQSYLSRIERGEVT
jgi:hypothetical protein